MNNDPQGFYKLLNVTPQASDKDIKTAFRTLSKTHHPDKGGDPQTFTKINEAYSILSNTEKRAHYDAHGNGSTGPEFDLGGMFAHMFNRPGAVQRRAPDKTITVKVNLQDVYQQVSRTLTYPVTVVCTGCKGAGSASEKRVDCGACQGQGVQSVRQSMPMGLGVQIIQRTCPVCRGHGHGTVPPEDACRSCAGERVVRGERKLVYQLDKRMPQEFDIRREGVGDECPDGQTGALVIHMVIRKDPVYERLPERDGLIIRHTLPLAQALCGGTYQVKHLDGSMLSMSLPMVTPQTTHVINGRGWTSDGDAHVMFDIQFPSPTALTNDQRAWIQEAGKTWM
jgi:DnaJ family protein A protein 2